MLWLERLSHLFISLRMAYNTNCASIFRYERGYGPQKVIQDPRIASDAGGMVISDEVGIATRESVKGIAEGDIIHHEAVST